MILIKDVMPVTFLKKEPFSGSYKGMRYRMEKNEAALSEDSDKKETFLKVCIWPQPLCFNKTPDENKIWNQFAFSSEGVALAVDWLNEIWERDYHH